MRVKDGWAERALAVVTYVGCFVVPLVVPLVIHLAARRRSRFVHLHAALAFNTQLTWFLVLAPCAGLAYLADRDIPSLSTLFFRVLFLLNCFYLVTLTSMAIEAAKGRLVQSPRWLTLPVIR